MRGPPVSRRFLRRARLLARRCHVAATPAPHTRLKGAVGIAHRRPDSRLPTTASRPALRQKRRRLPRHACHRPPLSAPDPACPSAPRHHVLAPPGHANPLHRRPRRSAPNRRAARRRRPRLAVPPDAAVYAHELMPRRRLRAGEARHVFPGHLPCVGEVAAAVQACRTAVRTLVPAKLGQVVGRARCDG
jgi:hypothetical protein